MAITVKPTRSELIRLKKRIQLAQSGYKLLKKKRDGMILEFFEILKRAKTARKQLAEQYQAALEKLAAARAIEGDEALRSLALAVKDKPQVSLDIRNIMGVRVPRVKAEFVQHNYSERGYGYLTTSLALEDAVSAYEDIMEYIILVAEVETAMRRLLEEIEKTKRRVNALEFSVIPGLQRLKSFIMFRLEELERENIFRTKMLKKRA